MSHYVVIEDFKILKKEKHNWIPEQKLILTETTKRNLRKILPAIQRNQNILLVGEAGIGKNALIYYINYLRNQTTFRFSFNEDLLPEDLIGSYRLDPITKNFIWIDGILIQAMKKGYTFVADEINLSNVDVLKRFQTVLINKEIELLEGNGEKIIADPSFQFIATQNPVEGYEGRKPLPREIQKYFITIWIDPYPKNEVLEILDALFPEIPIHLKKAIIDIQFQIEDWIKERKIATKDYEKYHFNIRNLKRLCLRIINEENIENLYSDIYDIFVRTFRNEEEKEMILKMIEQTFKKYNLENLFQKKVQKISISFDQNKNEIKIGRNYISLQDNNSEEFLKNLFSCFAPTKERLEVIDSLIRAIENQENVLLECDSNVEAEDYVYFISKLYNRPIQWIPLSKGIHTSDILGGLKPEKNSIVWIDGPLIKAIKQNDIIVFTNLESIGAELLEKLNMLLDDARAITLPAEAGQNLPIFLKENAIVIGIKYFRKSKNQNTISRAFRNRFTSIVLPEIVELESIKQIIENYLYFGNYNHLIETLSKIHLFIVSYAKKGEIGKDRMENYQFGLVNLYRFLDFFISPDIENTNITEFFLEAVEYAYLNEISNIEERNLLKEKIIEFLTNKASLLFEEILDLKKKLILIQTKKQNFFKHKIYWDQKEHFRNANTGKASWNKEFQELQKGIEINTPETGGNIKEGPDAWYGSDTLGNRGVGEPGSGGGAWGYRTEELYQQFLKKRKGLDNYSLGIPFADFKETFGKELESIIMQLEHLLDPDYNIKRNYQEKGTRVNIKKYLAFTNGKGNSKIFDKTIISKEENSLKDLEILFLINKGRRIFHFEYSVAILVAMMSIAEILAKHKIHYGVLGYSDLENFKKKIDIQWYKKIEEEYNEYIEQKLYYGIINHWSGDIVQDGRIIEEAYQIFSKDVRTKIIVIFSDFRGTRTKLDIQKEIQSYDFQYLKKIVEQLTKEKIIFLGITLGSRNLGNLIFENSVNITMNNLYSLPLILNEKISKLIQNYHYDS